jgi:hypothetical protein
VIIVLGLLKLSKTKSGVTRRKFMTAIAAAVGTAVVTACGGGGGNPASTGATVPASGATPGGPASSPVAPGSPVSPAVPAAGASTVVTTPDQPTKPDQPSTPTRQLPSKLFYGVNGHYDYNMYSSNQVVSMLSALGVTTYRLAYEDNQASLDVMVNMAQAFAQAKMNLIACIDLGICTGSTPDFANETAAYNQGFATGKTVANALAPFGVTIYECGNELTRAPIIIQNTAFMGTDPGDFKNAGWPIMRGAMRGMIDGVKSVQPDAYCAINFCVADIAASDMLWTGAQPDGTTGHPTVRWDITSWHNYQVYGDLFNISVDGDGNGAHFDLPAYCQKQYGVPFMITEWSANPEVTQAARATYLNDTLTKYYQNRKSHNIISTMYYELDSGDQTWGLVVNGTPNQVPYNAMKSMIAGNPDS